MAARLERHWLGLGLAIGTCLAVVAAPCTARAQWIERQPAEASPTSQPAKNILVSPDAADISRPPVIVNQKPADGDAELDVKLRRLPLGVRRVAKDGDLPEPEQNALATDGLVEVGEPPALPDGLDATKFDTRPVADAAAFAVPKGDQDPLLYQIEDIAPIEDRRILRLSRFEPFDPVGITVGSFVFFPEIVVAGSTNDNVFAAPRGQADKALDIIPAGRLVSNWSNHALELSATGNSKTYAEFDGENELGYAAEARGRFDIRRNTNIQGRLSVSRDQESRSAIDASQAGDRADVDSRLAALSLNHRFNRLSVQLRGSVGDTDYSDVATLRGVINNDDRDFDETSEAVRATWEFNPRLRALAEAEFNQREFDAVVRSDGIKRDSTGDRYRVGALFGSDNTKLRGEVSIGYARQKPDDSRLADVDGLLVDANVAWRISALTSLRLSARTDIFDTTEAGSAGVLERQAGIEVRHAFRRYLIATAGLAFADRDYSGIALSEDEIQFNAELEYFLRREAVLFATYNYTNFDSNEPDQDYDSNEFQLGMRIRR